VLANLDSLIGVYTPPRRNRKTLRSLARIEGQKGAVDLRSEAIETCLGQVSFELGQIDAISTTGGPFREANDSRNKPTREDWMRAGKRAMCVSARGKGAGQAWSI